MLRDKNLIPLSRQHQHALALCVRIERALKVNDIDLEPWQAEIQLIFEQEVSVHFDAEEQEIFPAAERFAEFKDLVRELRAEHILLRELVSRAVARSLGAADLRKFSETLSAHIRKEERQLFEGMQARMSADELGKIGIGLERELAAASESCFLPNEATRLRGKQ